MAISNTGIPPINDPYRVPEPNREPEERRSEPPREREEPPEPRTEEETGRGRNIDIYA